MEIKLTSPAFEDGGSIPSKYTCDGQDVSVPLQWDAVPGDTKSIALICDDPDAPVGVWVHWVIYNLPGDSTALGEGIAKDSELPDGSKQGLSDRI